MGRGRQEGRGHKGESSVDGEAGEGRRELGGYGLRWAQQGQRPRLGRTELIPVPHPAGDGG